MEHIKAICIDLDDTLWAVEPVIVRAEARVYSWFEEHCPNIPSRFSPDDIRELRRSVADEYPDKSHDLSYLRRMTFARIADGAGYPPEIADEAFEIFLTARNEVLLFDDVLPNLQRLAAHRPIFSLSNGNADLGAIGLADLFSGIFSAADLGVAKPDPLIFEKVCSSIGVAPENMMHVGDDPGNDIEAPRTIGMTTVWVNRKAAGWPPRMKPPHYEITDLHGLSELLGL